MKLRARDFWCVGLCQHTFRVCSQAHAETRLVVDERSLEDHSIELHALPSRGLSFSVRKERQCRVFAFSLSLSPLCAHLYGSIISASITAGQVRERWRERERRKYLRRGRDAGLFFLNIILFGIFSFCFLSLEFLIHSSWTRFFFLLETSSERSKN